MAKIMNTLTSGLACVSEVKLPGWGRRDPPSQWLETIGDMSQYLSQRHFYVRNFTSSV